MHRLGFHLIVLGASLVMLCSAFSEDSSDLFLKGYKDFQAGEKLEREAKPREALASIAPPSKSSSKSANWLRTGNRWSSSIACGKRRKASPDWRTTWPACRNRLSRSRETCRSRKRKNRFASRLSAGPIVTVKPPPAPKRGVNEPVRSTSLDRSVARGGLSVAERELRDLRSQLIQTRAENESLNERLLKKSADLQSALLEVDKTKVSVVELKAQLAQTTSSLEDMKKDGVSLSRYPRRARDKICRYFQALLRSAD